MPEVNFDGIVGPTHNYSGMSFGNVASASNRGLASNPRAAALQGLEKMRALLEMGIVQGVLWPHERPHVRGLRALGFGGSDADVLEAAWRRDPMLLARYCSASPMWTANAATVCPSADSVDGRVHFTAANLRSMPHRALEAETTARQLRAIFCDENHFEVNDCLPDLEDLGDEGAANHNRLCAAHEAQGVQVFVYGQDGNGAASSVYPARQTLGASRRVAQLNRLKSDAVFVQQGAGAIDGGAFHNDVVCVMNQSVALFHEDAFADCAGAMAAMRRACGPLGFEPAFIVARRGELPLSDAVKSYVFNSQLISKADGGMALILPCDAEENVAARAFVQRIVAENNPVTEARYLELRQSMRNGGGPACLRLRVVLTELELKQARQSVLLSEQLADRLCLWVETHYRDRLAPDDFRDPALLSESRAALDELTSILGLGSFYDFQRETSDAPLGRLA